MLSFLVLCFIKDPLSARIEREAPFWQGRGCIRWRALDTVHSQTRIETGQKQPEGSRVGKAGSGKIDFSLVSAHPARDGRRARDAKMEIE